MLRNKSLIIVSILVLVLAVVAMACAPATPAKPVVPTPVVPTPVVPAPVVPTPVVPTPVVPTPATPTPVAPAPEITTSFEAATYTNETPGFTLKYPKAWVSGNVVLKGGVFFAQGDDGLVYVAVRPATDFQEAAITFMKDLIALRANVNPELVSVKEVTFADGKTKGTEIMLSALFGSQKASIYGVIKDGNAIMVMNGTNPKNLTLYSEVGKTLSVK